MPTKCEVCQSINHWAQNCPDRCTHENSTYILNEVVLHQIDYDNPQKLKFLMSETWSAVLHDCGTSKTICGKERLSHFVNNLCEEDQQQIQYCESNHVYWFGDGKKLKATHSAKILALLGNKHITIQTDVTENDIPLLLSKSSMKKAKMTLDFQNDIANAFGEKIPLITTSSGHYAIPITKVKQIITKEHCSATSKVTLTVSNTKSEKQLALKVHHQFSHRSKEKLLQIIQKLHPCGLINKELTMSNIFLETVEMDLKHYKGKILLHIVDHCTRLSALTVIPNKQLETIIKYIFKIQLSS